MLRLCALGALGLAAGRCTHATCEDDAEVLLQAHAAVNRSFTGRLKDREKPDGYSFEDFMADFGKHYKGSELEKRKSLFEAAVAQVKQHNAQGLGYNLGINEFADWTADELTNLRGYKKTGKSPKAMTHSSGADKPVLLPPSFDWRDKGMVSPVKNQGHCGSCWAFAATSTMESHAAIASKVMTELSSQQLVSCVENPRACGGTGGCDGATAELAFEYLVDHPQTFEDVVSYQNFFGGKVACSDTIESHASRYPVVSITGFVKLPVNEYEALMEALVTKGPISVSVDASGWSPYSSGVADFCPTDENVDIDHAVVLVAYGGDGDNKYWTIKNSWGPTWGEKGYIRLKRHDDEGKHCGWDKTPSHGSLCADEEDKPEWVCGTCGVLFDTSHPVGSKVIGASEGDVDR